MQCCITAEEPDAGRGIVVARSRTAKPARVQVVTSAAALGESILDREFPSCPVVTASARTCASFGVSQCLSTPTSPEYPSFAVQHLQQSSGKGVRPATSRNFDEPLLCSAGQAPVQQPAAADSFRANAEHSIDVTQDAASVSDYVIPPHPECLSPVGFPSSSTELVVLESSCTCAVHEEHTQRPAESSGSV